MNNVDIGIDLGTASVIIYAHGKGIVLKEPSVVAVNSRTGDVLSVGTEAYKMLGRTPDKIRAVRPLSDGVIADYDICEKMVKYFLKKVCSGSLIKPRVAICVPSGVTGVESRAVVDAAVAAGARKVYLIEEPVAAAIGAGVDITEANGVLILDIGGGTSDVAILSLGGIVTKRSLKIAGNKIDDAIVRYVRDRYNVLIGQKMAESAKIGVCSVDPHYEDREMDLKGRNLLSGLPQKFTVSTEELLEPVMEPVSQILFAVQGVLERTPPELVGDIFTNGLLLTGGGAQLNGLPQLIRAVLKIDARLAPSPDECVAIGTGRCFALPRMLNDGLFESDMRN